MSGDPVTVVAEVVVSYAIAWSALALGLLGGIWFLRLAAQHPELHPARVVALMLWPFDALRAEWREHEAATVSQQWTRAQAEREGRAA